MKKTLRAKQAAAKTRAARVVCQMIVAYFGGPEDEDICGSDAVEYACNTVLPIAREALGKAGQ